jgi:apolipoprotein N-acyltransferase
LPLLRKRPDVPEAKLTIRCGLFISLASIALILWLLSSVKQSEAIQIAVAGLIGLGIYFLFRVFRKPLAPQPSE